MVRLVVTSLLVVLLRVYDPKHIVLLYTYILLLKKEFECRTSTEWY